MDGYSARISDDTRHFLELAGELVYCVWWADTAIESGGKVAMDFADIHWGHLRAVLIIIVATGLLSRLCPTYILLYEMARSLNAYRE